MRERKTVLDMLQVLALASPLQPGQHPEPLSYPAAWMMFVYKCTSALCSLPPPTFISLWRQTASSVHPTLTPNPPNHQITLSAEAALLLDADCSRDGQQVLTVLWQHEEPPLNTAWPALTLQWRKRRKRKKTPCSSGNQRYGYWKTSHQFCFEQLRKNNVFMWQIRCSDLERFHVENLTRWTSDKWGA